MNTETITLLVRESSKIGECLSSVDLFCRSESKIQVILIGETPQSVYDNKSLRLDSFQRAGVEFYTDTPGHMESYGFQVVNQREIAAFLTRADVVIPL